MADKIEIKKRCVKNKCLRARRKSTEDDDEEETCTSKIEEMKVVQKLRQRPRGVDLKELTEGERGSSPTSVRTEGGDPFKVKTGGMVSLKNINASKTADDAYDVGIGTQFSAETNKRDEDEEMMKYIDQQVSKKASEETPSSAEAASSNKYLTPEEAALQAVPQHLRTNAGVRSEEMLSNQMLSGIPEVDLGIESKIRNIEATEEAKLKLLLAQRNKPDGPSDFVPANITVNFASKAAEDERKRKVEKRPRVDTSAPRPEGGKTAKERATDDLIYARFKKASSTWR